MGITDTVDRFRQPEYTGTNRCVPCTVVNLFIAVVLAGVVGVVVPWVGSVAFVAFLGIIYVRGYLVPGTPALTKRYLPAPVLRLFGKAPVERTVESGVESENGTDATERGALVAAGIVDRTGTDDVALASGFREEWNERIRTHREPPDAEDVRTMFDAETVSRHGDQSFVVDGNTSVRWESAAAFVADVAASPVLETRLDGWRTLEWDRRRAVLTGLRLCLDRCPSCDGAVETTDDRADPCCQQPHLIQRAVCEDCGAPLADAAVVDDGSGSVRLRLLHP